MSRSRISISSKVLSKSDLPLIKQQQQQLLQYAGLEQFQVSITSEVIYESDVPLVQQQLKSTAAALRKSKAVCS
jgi:hypothetical protein